MEVIPELHQVRLDAQSRIEGIPRHGIRRPLEVFRVKIRQDFLTDPQESGIMAVNRAPRRAGKPNPHEPDQVHPQIPQMIPGLLGDLTKGNPLPCLA